MAVERIELIHLEVPYLHFFETSFGRETIKTCLLVKVFSEGVCGYGEAYSVPFHPATVAKMIEDVCERLVIGSDPFRIERLWRIVYSSGYSQRPDVSLMGVLSGIEMACWDIVGKELGRPVHDLLGGKS